MVGFGCSDKYQHPEAPAICWFEFMRMYIAKLRVYLIPPDQYDSRSCKAWIFHHPFYKQSRLLNLRKTPHGSWVVTYYVATGGEFKLGSCTGRAFLHLKFRTWLRMMKAVIII